MYKENDLVYVKSTNSIGCVMSFIDNTSQELRTDVDGMRCFSELEHFNLSHMDKNPFVAASLKEELFNISVSGLSDISLFRKSYKQMLDNLAYYDEYGTLSIRVSKVAEPSKQHVPLDKLK